LPDFAKVAKKYKKKGVEIVGFNIEDPGAKVGAVIKKTLEKAGVTYTNVHSDKNLLAGLPRFTAIPTTFFVDHNGIIVKTHTGALSEQELSKIVTQLAVNAYQKGK